MSIYIHVCAQALLSIRWGIDGDFYFLLVMPLWCVDGELSSQQHGGKSMLCNGSWLDRDEFAHPSLATITGGTSMGNFVIPVHGYRRCWRHDWTYQLPPIPEVVHALDGHRNTKRFSYYCIDAHI